MADETTTLVATETFATEVDGVPYTVHKGETRISSDHPLAKAAPGLFADAGDRLTFPDVEQATAAPGEKRGEPKSRAAAKK